MRGRAFLFAAACAAWTLVLGGCNYGFIGGGLPDRIRSVAIVPFENETTRFELTQELNTVLLRDLPSALGVQTAGQENADAIVRGTITSYEVNAPNFRTSADGTRAEVVQREVVITIQVEILDVVENVILWEGSSVRAEGVFLEASEPEEVGKEEAIRLLVQEIVDGAQSNW